VQNLTSLFLLPRPTKVTKFRAYLAYRFRELTRDRQTDTRQRRRPKQNALTLSVRA